MRQALIQAAKVTLPIWLLFQLISYTSKQWYAAMDREFIRGCSMGVGQLHPPDVRAMVCGNLLTAVRNRSILKANAQENKKFQEKKK